MEKPYTVFVDDNFHYMDETERVKHGDYATLEEAERVCRAMIDDYLNNEYKPGLTATKLYDQYESFGEDPFILGPGADFSAWTYAKQRCETLCGGRVDPKRK